MTILNSQSELNAPVVATIGYFDGLHLGHKFLLDDLKREAKTRGLKTMVVTFSNHPMLLFKPDCGLKFLTNCDEKLKLIEESNIDYCLLLPFTRELASLKSSDFIAHLHKQFALNCLLVGYDHKFGSDRDSTFDDYVRYGKASNVDVVRCEAFKVSDINVSSSKIRKAIQTGDISLANSLLGYNYRINGSVVAGHQVGRKIGFPTANLAVDPTKLMPACGVYGVKVFIKDKVYPGMMNIGHRPTLDNGEITNEVYIDTFEGDLYGCELRLEVRKFLRIEQKFDSLEALQQQLFADLQQIRTLQ